MGIINKTQTLILSGLLAGITVTVFGLPDSLMISDRVDNPIDHSSATGTYIELYCNEQQTNMPNSGLHRDPPPLSWDNTYEVGTTFSSDTPYATMLKELYPGGYDSSNWTLYCLAQGTYVDHSGSDTDKWGWQYVNLGSMMISYTDGVYTSSENLVSSIYPFSLTQTVLPSGDKTNTYLQYGS